MRIDALDITVSLDSLAQHGLPFATLCVANLVLRKRDALALSVELDLNDAACNPVDFGDDAESRASHPQITTGMKFDTVANGECLPVGIVEWTGHDSLTPF